jgi:hypothetical protein
LGKIKSRLNALNNFLSLHPICCFCGGIEKATTQDHLPPKSVFDSKKWPIGYVFPACSKCNNDSSKYDSIFALVSRIYPSGKESELVSRETEKLIKAYVEVYPDEAASAVLSANQKRRLAKKHGLQAAAGQTYGELPIMKVPDSWNHAIQFVNAKLIKALHYKHTGKIIPQGSALRTKWWTNAEFLLGKFPNEFSMLVREDVQLKRDKVSLNTQFSYSFQTSDDGRLGIYGIYFRRSFYVVGLVAFDANLLKNKKDVNKVDA